MSLTVITSVSQLNGILSSSAGKLSIIDFHATWCGPCKMIAPVYADLAKSNPNVNFLKCDVDEAKDVAQAYGVTAMPTFVFLQGKNKVHEVRGADRAGLIKAIKDYSSGSSGGTTAFSGKGQTLGGAPAPAAPGIGTDGLINLTPQAKVLLGLVGAYIVLWYFS